MNIQSYIDTNNELILVRSRYLLLCDKKDLIYTKYFKLTPQLKERVSGSATTDNFNQYVYEINKINPITNMSIVEEMEYLKKEMELLEKYINVMKDTLKQLKGVKYELFYEIVISGLKVTKAVEKVAECNNIEPQTVWKYHYPIVKKYIKSMNV